jgi:hypothetical protein
MGLDRVDAHTASWRRAPDWVRHVTARVCTPGTELQLEASHGPQGSMAHATKESAQGKRLQGLTVGGLSWSDVGAEGVPTGDEE